MPRRNISTERQTAYYVGMALIAVGLLLFASVFVTAAASFGRFGDFEAQARSDMYRAIGGMALILVGGIVQGIGARGLAGCGVILDPEQARQDLEPYARMAGGMVKDALDEADVHLGGSAEKVVLLKCTACGRLNAEDAKYCQECGKPL